MKLTKPRLQKRRVDPTRRGESLENGGASEKERLKEDTKEAKGHALTFSGG